MKYGSHRFSDEEIEEFKAIWKKEYGKKLTDEEAVEYAEQLISLLEVIIKP